MKNFKALLAGSLLALCVVAMSSCDKDDDGGKTAGGKKYTLSINISYPEDVNMADVQGLSISATNEKEQSYSVDTALLSKACN